MTTTRLQPPQTPQDFRSCSSWSLLPEAIYHEARGEPFDGKVGVGEVIMRRVRSGYRGKDTVSGVVLDPQQFSPFNEATKRPDPSSSIFAECCAAAALAVSGTTDFTRGAMHFLNPKISRPSWYDPAKVVARIGNHEFLAGVDAD